MDKPIDTIRFVITYHPGGGDQYISAEFDPPAWFAESEELNGILEDESLSNICERINRLTNRILRDPDWLVSVGFVPNPHIEIIMEPRKKP